MSANGFFSTHLLKDLSSYPANISHLDHFIVNIQSVGLQKMAGAICIVTVNERNPSEVHGETLKRILLQNEDLGNRKIVPISITGAMRTGKSFMLNYFLRYLKAQYVTKDISNWLGDGGEPLTGFDSYAFSDRVTCGILMWSEVFLYDSKKHGPLAIVLMDTQGLFDNKTTLKENCVIFALSTMMASVQIYNVMNNFNENDLQLLHMFAEYGKAAMESTAAKPFQELMILVRDWNPQHGLELGSKGGRKLVKKRMTGDTRMKSIREDIYGSFEFLDGFLMCNPGDHLNESYFDGSVECLDEKFVKNLKDFVELVLKPDNLVPKRINDEIVNMVSYVNHFKFYAEYFRNKDPPSPGNFTEAIANCNVK